MTDWNERAARALERVRAERVLVHSITNYVVMNSTANTLLAIGAAPVMAHALDEVEDMVGLARAVVLNIGTLEPSWVTAMRLAGRAANRRGIPVVLDPVGSGATPYRTATASALARELHLAVIRGNASEVLSLTSAEVATRGVDAAHDVEDAARVAAGLAEELDTTLAVTGRVDLVTDGATTLRVEGGHPLVTRVTGTGCAATVLVAAFAAVESEPVAAAAGALASFKLAAETAADLCRGRSGGTEAGPGSFQVALYDALASLEPEALRAAGKIQEVGR